MNNEIYISIDANETGKKLERLILTEQYEDLRNFSNMLTNFILSLSSFIKENKGNILMAGGDNILATIPQAKVHLILAEVAKANKGTCFKFSIGLGYNAPASYFALKYAKVNGISCISFVDNSFKKIEFE